MTCILKGGMIVSGEGLYKADILIENEKITRIDSSISSSRANVIDVSDRLLFPGFIDAHTHFDLEVSGTITADDFNTGTKAAISGGTTMIIDFATQNKGETLTEALENWHKKADGKCSCDYGFHMAISQWNPVIEEQMKCMINEGIPSFKLYMTYEMMYLKDENLYKALKRIGELHGIAGIHCENKDMIDALIEENKYAGNYETRYYPQTRPPEVEAEAVNRILNIAAIAKVPVVIVHLSTKLGYEEVLQARTRGQKVYLETCPQYLILDESQYRLAEDESRKYVIAPPLREKINQETLWKGAINGEIQTIATDHCSFRMDQKEKGKFDFTQIPCGMPGVETRPSLIYTYGVVKRNMSLEQMCKLLSENVAKIYGVYPKKGAIAVGSDADIVVWNPNTTRTLTVNQQVANVDYQPYEGMEVKGSAQKVFLRGELVAQDGVVICENKGCYIKRKIDI